MPTVGPRWDAGRANPVLSAALNPPVNLQGPTTGSPTSRPRGGQCRLKRGSRPSQRRVFTSLSSDNGPLAFCHPAPLHQELPGDRVGLVRSSPLLLFFCQIVGDRGGWTVDMCKVWLSQGPSRQGWIHPGVRVGRVQRCEEPHHVGGSHTERVSPLQAPMGIVMGTGAALSSFALISLQLRARIPRVSGPCLPHPRSATWQL